MAADDRGQGAQESMPGRERSDQPGPRARGQVKTISARIELSPQQGAYLAQLTTPGSGEIQGADWAPVVGLGVNDGFWEQDPRGEQVAFLPHGDTTVQVSARGCDGIRHTRVYLDGDHLHIESSPNCPIDPEDLATVIALNVGDDDPVDLNAAWLARDRAQDTATQYAWPDRSSITDAPRFAEALRQLDEPLAEAVMRLRDPDLPAAYIDTLAAGILDQLAATQRDAQAMFDQPLAEFAFCAASHVRKLATIQHATTRSSGAPAGTTDTPLPPPVDVPHDPQAPTPEGPGAAAALQDVSAAPPDPREADPAEDHLDRKVATAGPDPAHGSRRADAHQVAEALLHGHMERVEADLRMFRVRVHGAHSVLDEAPEPHAHQSYRRWELGLQRLEKAYGAAAQHGVALSAKAEWQEIVQIWQNVHRLGQHAARLGAPIVQRCEDQLRHLVAMSASLIGDLSLLLAPPASRENSPAHGALHELGLTGASVAADLRQSAPSAPWGAREPGQGHDPDRQNTIAAARPPEHRPPPESPTDLPLQILARYRQSRSTGTATPRRPHPGPVSAVRPPPPVRAR
jgi:hypothetical protein